MASHLSQLLHRPASAPEPCCRLFALPRELQDIVFDLAYPAENIPSYRPKAHWSRDEARRYLSRPGHNVRSFLVHKVADFMINKRFFVIAAKAWVRNQVFDYRLKSKNIGHDDAHVECSGWLSRSRPEGILAAFVAKLTVEDYASHGVHTLPQLRDLCIVIHDNSTFALLEPGKVASRDLLTSDEVSQVALRRLPMFRELVLESLDVVPAHHVRSYSETGSWVENRNCARS